jgi:hypothetical protein
LLDRHVLPAILNRQNVGKKPISPASAVAIIAPGLVCACLLQQISQGDAKVT